MTYTNGPPPPPGQASGAHASGARRAGRPTDPRKAEAALEAAWSLFLTRGVEATTMEAVASLAKVSKVTLYRRFPDKTALFKAAVAREMRRIEEAQRTAGASDAAAPLRDRLHAFGMGVMSFLTRPPAADFAAALMGELRRHPELAQAFYALGPGRTRATLAALLKQGMAVGELCPGDPEHAAEALFGLWQGFTPMQIGLGIDPDGAVADVEGRVSRGIAAFLHVYDARGASADAAAPPDRP